MFSDCKALLGYALWDILMDERSDPEVAEATVKGGGGRRSPEFLSRDVLAKLPGTVDSLRRLFDFTLS